MPDEGQWLTDMNGDRRWYASPERERCGGSGYINCYCGGDLCVCANGGEIECDGCEDCETQDDDGYEYYDDSYDEASPDENR